MTTNPTFLPLYERTTIKNTIARAVELLILFLLFFLLFYRLLSLKDHGFTWLLAFLCESWFTFTWLLCVSTKWNPVEYKTYPQRLLQRKPELPPVDMFVTTADAVLEPPIITVNTVLSLLAVDYPSEKLACYVSDDGCSPLTFYSLVEASKFAKLWVPFCKKYNVEVRAPFRYFHGDTMSSKDISGEFQREWNEIKDEYERLSQKIEDAAKRPMPCELTGEFADFLNTERRNHQTIIKVIWENKQSQPNGIPHLVYMSREKRPRHLHNFKAGAMNVLARVSGIMTNAPFMLNVDCDMYVNNPQTVLHAMCFLLSEDNEKDSAYVQFPQCFYGGLEDDPFGNQLLILYRYIGHGVVGIQGPFYGGTGCFHRRKVIYGLSADENDSSGKLSDQALAKTFGSSMELSKSAARTLSSSNEVGVQFDMSSSMEAAFKVAASSYEYGSSWGHKEDVQTGLNIHGRGWRSVFCTPNPPAFLGCAPTGGPATITQQKRWATGFLEIFFSRSNPFILTLTGKLRFRQCLAYTWLLLWGPRSIPELCYAVLPAYCIITNSSFLPKEGEPAIVIPIALFVIYNLHTLCENLRIGLSAREWWNNQRMWRVNAMSGWFFGTLSVLLKLLGLSDTVFEVTQKDQSTNGDENSAHARRFTFDESPVFISGTTILLVNLTGLATGLLGFRPVDIPAGMGSGVGELVCSMWVVLCYWPFLRGLFGKGKYGIPSSTILKSGALAVLFVHLCRWTMG